MRNYVADTNNFGINVPNDVLGGDIFVIGNLALVSPVAAPQGQRVAALSYGIFNFKIVGTFTAGMPVFYSKANKNIVPAPNGADTIAIGYTLESGANQNCRVLFSPMSSIKGDKGDQGAKGDKGDKGDKGGA